MNDQHEEELTKLKDSHLQEMEALKSNMKKMKKQWETDILQQVKQLEGNWKQELDKSNESHKNLQKSLEDKLATYEQEAQQTQSKFAETEDLIKAKELEISKLMETNRQLENDKVVIENGHKVKADEVKNKYEKRIVKTLEEQETKMKQHLEEVMEKVTNQYQTKLKDNIKKSKEIITKKDENICDLQTVISNLKSEIALKDSKIQQLESDIVAQQTNFTQFKVDAESKVLSYNKESSIFSSQIKDYELKVSTLKESLSEFQSTKIKLDQLNVEIASLKSKLQQKESDCIKIRSELSEELKAAQIEYQLKIKQLSQSQAIELENTSKLYSEELNQISKSNKSELSKFENVKSQLEGEIKALRQNIEEIKQKYQNEKLQLNNRINELSSQKSGDEQKYLEEIQMLNLKISNITTEHEEKLQLLTVAYKAKERSSLELVQSLEENIKHQEFEIKEKETEIKQKENEISSMQQKYNEEMGKMKRNNQISIKQLNDLNIEDIQKLNLSFDQEKESIITQKNNIQHELDLLKSQYESEAQELNQQISLLKEKLDKSQNEKSQLQKKIAELNNSTIQLKVSSDIAISKQTEEFERRILQLQTENKSAAINYKSQIQSLTEDYEDKEAQLNEQIEQLKSQLEMATTKYENELKLKTQSIVDLRTKLEETKHECSSETSHLASEYHTKIQNLSLQHNKEIESLKDKYEARLEQSKLDLNEKISKLKSEYEAATSSLEQESQSKIFSLSTANDRALIEAAQKYEQKIGIISKEFETHIEELKQEGESKDNEIKRLHSKIDEVEFDLRFKQTEIDKLNIEIKSKLSQLKSEQQKCQDIKESYEKNLTQLKTAMDDGLRQSVDQNQSLESKFSQEITEKSQAILDLNSKINDLKINFECEQNNYEKEKLILKEEIKQLKKQCENDKYAYQSKIYELKTKSENEENENQLKLASKHAEELESLKQQFDLKVSQLQEQVNSLSTKNADVYLSQKKIATDYEEKIVNFESNIESLQQTISSLEGYLEEKNKENEDLNTTIEEYEFEIDQLKKNIQELKSKQEMLNESKEKSQETIATINQKYEKKIDSINKITSILEKEAFTTRLEIGKYDHKKMFSKITEGINNTFDEELCKPAQDLFSIILMKGTPKTSNLDKSFKPPLSRNKLEMKSIGFSSVYSESPSKSFMSSRMSNNNSMISSCNSNMDETMMTDICEYIDQDKAAIYQVVEDLVNMVEIQELIRQSETWNNAPKLKVPERRKRLGMELFMLAPKSIQVNQSISSSLNSPFEQFSEVDELPQLPLIEQHQIITERIIEIFAPFRNFSFLQNVEETFIDNIHSYCKKHLKSLIEDVSKQQMKVSSEDDSLIQKLNNVKRQVAGSKSSLHELLYSMDVLNISLVHLLNHVTKQSNQVTSRLISLLTTALHSDLYNREFVLRNKEKAIEQIQEEAYAKEREIEVLQTIHEEEKRLMKITEQHILDDNKLTVQNVKAVEKKKTKKHIKSKVEAVTKLKETHGSTGKFLINESMKQTENLFTDLLHLFVYKSQGFTFDPDEL